MVDEILLDSLKPLTQHACRHMNLKLKCPNLVACLEVLNLESKVK